TNFYGADCYNAVKQGLSIFLALTLAKLFETPGLWRGKSKSFRFNNSDVASIPLMMRLLKQARCRKGLSKRAQHWTPQIPEITEAQANACECAIDKAIAAYERLRGTRDGKNAVAKLKKFRNKVLAHTLLGAAVRSAPQYRELFWLVDVARDVVEHSRLAI